MSNFVVRAYVHHYDDNGCRTQPAERIFALLCWSDRKGKEVLDIPFHDKRDKNLRSIQITRAELERVLALPRPDGGRP